MVKYLNVLWFVAVVQSLSHVWLLMIPWIAARQASLSFTISWSLLKLVSIELVMPWLCVTNTFILEKAMAPTPVRLPGKSRGRRSRVGCSPWGCWESGTTERLHFHALEKEMATHSKWQPNPVFLPGESQGRGSLVGCRLWGRTESDTTEAT